MHDPHLFPHHFVVGTVVSFLSHSTQERDEVKEIQKMTHTDTARVNRWRVAATMVLLLTAVAVTATTYSILKKEEAGNFDTGVSQKQLQYLTPLLL